MKILTRKEKTNHQIDLLQEIIDKGWWLDLEVGLDWIDYI